MWRNSLQGKHMQNNIFPHRKKYLHINTIVEIHVTITYSWGAKKALRHEYNIVFFHFQKWKHSRKEKYTPIFWKMHNLINRARKILLWATSLIILSFQVAKINLLDFSSSIMENLLIE